jgi:hypothetical protein
MPKREFRVPLSLAPPIAASAAAAQSYPTCEFVHRESCALPKELNSRSGPWASTEKDKHGIH